MVDVEGVYDRGLTCRAVPLCELTVLGEQPAFETDAPPLGPVVTLYSARYALGVDDAVYHVRVDTDVGPGEQPLVGIERCGVRYGPEPLARLLERLAPFGRLAAAWAHLRTTEALRYVTPPEAEDDR